MVRPASLLVAAVLALAAAPAHRDGIAEVAWLAGCWEARSPKRLIEEQWTAPRGRTMLGMSRTIRGDSLVEYELIVLREVGTALHYEAHPAGQAGAIFDATAVSPTHASFENPAHDFPTRITYRRVGRDSLLAEVAGPSAAGERSFTIRYRRARCAGR